MAEPGIYVQAGPYVLAGVAFLSLIANVLIARKTAERTELTTYFQTDVCLPVYDNLTDLKKELVCLIGELIDRHQEEQYGSASGLLDARRITIVGPIISELSQRIGAAVDAYGDESNGVRTLFIKWRICSESKLRNAVTSLEESAVDGLWNALEDLSCQLNGEGTKKLDCNGLIRARIELDNSVRAVVNELRRQFMRRHSLLRLLIF